MRAGLIRSLAMLICGTAVCAFAVLQIPNTQPKVDESFWNKVLDKTWDGLKKRNIAPYENGVGAGLIHRPKSEYPGDAVSEAVGYGMLVALYADDQATFNKIWAAGNKNMWNGSYYDWHLLPSGSKEYGAATDAEEDIILALLFAQKLVDAGKWQPYTDNGTSYMDRAMTMMDKMWSTRQITSQGTLAPGAGWGGEDFVNVGYFSPAWYKIFAMYDKEHDWKKVVDRSYEIIGKSPAYERGLVPDWMTPSGGYVGGAGLGYNAYFDSRAFFKDAIRILWRVAIDAVWFNDERAIAFLENAMNFINSKGGAKAANFYQMSGELLPAGDVWSDLNGGTITRHRREHSPLTIGMWATAAMAVASNEDRAAFSLEMFQFYDEDADYFGLAVDESGAEEDTLHNEMYFEQFLAWFGTSLMTGVFCNIVDDIDNPKENVPGFKTQLSILDPKKEEEESIVTRRIASIKFNVSRKGNFVELSSSEKDARWTIYSLKGGLVAELEGMNATWNATGKTGAFVVKLSSSRGQKGVRKFIVP